MSAGGHDRRRSTTVEAVTLDFFNTLVFHRDGRGRGRALVEYLEAQGYRPRPWEHQVLYDVFEAHEHAYSPSMSSSDRARYLGDLATRIFARLGIDIAPDEAVRHADRLWDVLGPSCFEVFDDVRESLEALRARSVPLAVISNWQRGLRHFCAELDLARYFDHIIGSADVGVAKPDERIFHHAASRLGVVPGRILHVGDTLVDDYHGGVSAGVGVALLDRASAVADDGVHRIRSLRELPGLIDP